VVTEVDRQIAGRYTVQSVARALRLVEIVAGGPPGGVSLSELARTLGASKSSTLALARTLVAFGYLRDAYPGPGYTLGTGLIRLGDIVGRQLPLGDLCRPLIEGLSRATEMTSRVAISDQGYPVFVVREDGPGSVRFHTPLGQRELPYASAAGKAILAAMDEEEIRRMCAETGLVPRTAHTITDIDTLLDNLAVARRLGFAVDDEEDAEGIICVGAAFFGHDGSCAGAVSVTGIKGDLPAWRIDELGRVVRRCADEISGILGGSPYVGLSLVGVLAGSSPLP
jgi:IclR family acetate operon transcriptional repressor